MNDADLDVVAPLVIDYYNWLTGNGGTDPKVLLSIPLTPAQRRLMLERLDDVNVIYAITSPLRRAAGRESSESSWSSGIDQLCEPN